MARDVIFSLKHTQLQQLRKCCGKNFKFAFNTEIGKLRPARYFSARNTFFFKTEPKRFFN